MLHETAINPDYIPRSQLDSPSPSQPATDALSEIISSFMTVHAMRDIAIGDLPAEDQAILARGESLLIRSFYGTLTDDAEFVYEALDQQLREQDLYALLRQTNQPDMPHCIHIAKKRPAVPKPYPVWVNIVLFLATIVSVLFTGTTIAIGEIGLTDPLLASQMGASMNSIFMELWRGYPYALAVLLILGAHEMGHYWMMRHHKTHASLPYFLPAFMISPFGTFGAAIVLRESLKNRKTLLDVGVAGPLAGFILAVPIVIIGLATSHVLPITPGGMVEGNSLIYALAKIIVFGEVLPNGTVDVLVNQLAWAGWTGLFVTALNMIPLGQLDGGHVLYALFGDHARRLYMPLLVGMLGLALFVSSTWLFFLILLFFVGRFYAVPLDNITPLDPKRRILAWVGLAIFVLSFTPTPLYQMGEAGGVLGGMTAQTGTLLVGVLLVLPRWLLRR